jgi:hypothetical protein
MKILIILITLLLNASAQNIGESIYKNIILKDIKEANQNLNKLNLLVDKNASERELKDSFRDLMMSWKRVETLYLAGDLDEDFIDTPRYIDIFHNTKENIYKQLNHILLSSDALDIELFKNSNKSINALEYLIFKPSQKTPRQKEMITYILKHIGMHLKDIETFYQNSKTKFLKNEQKINAIIMNALIESSYKLKEWRVGDPAGLSRKYKNNPKNERSEYPISKLSYKAIEAILLTHQAIIGKQKFINFADIVKTVDADKELLNVQNSIKNALKYLQSAPAYDFNSKEIKSLYHELTALHNAYFISIIGALKITSKIIDSDGD